MELKCLKDLSLKQLGEASKSLNKEGLPQLRDTIT